MASQMTITQNLLNILNRMNCDKIYYDAEDEPTTFSNAPTVDGGRNLMCYYAYAENPTDNVIDHASSNTATQKLVRVASGGILHSPTPTSTSDKRIYVYDTQMQRSTLSDIRDTCRFGNFGEILLPSDAMRTDTYSLECIDFRTRDYTSTSHRVSMRLGLIQGTGDIFTSGGTNFNGKLLCVAPSQCTGLTVPKSGAACYKVTQQVISDTFTEIDAIMISLGYYSRYSSENQAPVPIMATLKLSSPIAVSNGDTVQVTLDIASVFSLS